MLHSFGCVVVFVCAIVLAVAYDAVDPVDRSSPFARSYDLFVSKQEESASSSAGAASMAANAQLAQQPNPLLNDEASINPLQHNINSYYHVRTTPRLGVAT